MWHHNDQMAQMMHAVEFNNVLELGIDGYCYWFFDHVWSEIKPFFTILVTDISKDP